ncbi:LytR C-terminal domain-containing protein [Streptomyces sp. MUM 178J]|uniref:LytR C-terminal domain-containing protein n=1 Tax=Streptomyces sp. MUM 178J TaxID=2791991 RepID=UPI001F04CA5B|nr:LytR C-terminal domain-containing protein [Streptomyces sp. MUM 178J]WRQ79401.1 LytR C-terminal domain-containing protein [Streptomyces sp. MUM 178J]
MNDQQQPYDPYYPQPQLIGYDEYGQPVYAQPQSQPQARPQQQNYGGYDPYAQPQDGQGYGYDPYAQPQQYDPYAQQGYGYDPSAPAAASAGEHGYAPQQWSSPQQHAQAQPGTPERTSTAVPDAAVPDQRQSGRRRAPADDGGAGDGGGYRTEQFSFIEEPDEDSEDVIDWLKFTESRSERREEAKRRGRNRIVGLIVVMALAVVGGVGYLWYAGKFPGMSDSQKQNTTAASGPQKRDVIVVHLHNTKKEGTSTALLVDNTTRGHGTSVLLPRSLSVAQDDGTATTLGKSVEDDGSTGTREALGSLLGAKISGTWRLDTPYLENLVELVGGIDLTTDIEVPAAKKGEEPQVKKGENQTLDGRAAVSYATYLAPGEAEQKQLQRFGQVMQGVLRKFPDDPKSATVIVETLAQILDPSLTEKDLGASLASLARHAKGGDYTTAVLPVEEDGTLSQEATDSVVKDVLGGSVSAPEQGVAVRVGIRNATGDDAAAEPARVTLVNGGYSVVDAGKADTETTSSVTYGDETEKAKAVEVAKTLGLPESAVEKGETVRNAQVAVTLGKDFEYGRE